MVGWPYRGLDRSWFQFSGELGAEEPVMYEGAWSLFQLIQASELTNTGRTSYRVTFRQGQHSAVYDVRIGGAGDILSPSLFRELTVPGKL